MKKIDLTAQKFHRLLILEEVPKDTRNNIKPVWKCQCDCGKIVAVEACKLKNGNTKSCGCLRSEVSAKQLSAAAMTRKKYTPREASARTIFKSYGDGNIPFDVFYNKLSQNNCFYCDRAPFLIFKGITNHNSKEFIDTCAFIYNGLDRLNNTKPHNLDNVITACHKCNFAKNVLTPREFYNLIQRIHQTIGTKSIHDLQSAITIPNIQVIQSSMEKNGLFKESKPTRTKTIYFDGIFRRSKYNDGDIDFHSFYHLTQLYCFYCGISPSNCRRITTDLSINYSGLDRINSNLPHTINNVLPACKFCNFAKGTQTFDEFKNFIGILHKTFGLDKVLYLEANFSIQKHLPDIKPLVARKRKKYPRKSSEKKIFPPGSKPGMIGYKIPDTIKQKMSDIARTNNRSRGEKKSKGQYHRRTSNQHQKTFANQ